MFSFEGVRARDRVLIHQFVERYYHSLKLIKAKKYEEGKRFYGELLDLFKQMNQKKELDDIHKQLAYNCVRDVYSNLSEMEVSPLTDKTFKMLLSVTIIIILIGILLLLKPDIAGMFSADVSEGPVWIAGLNTFSINSISKFNLEEFFFSENELSYSATNSKGVDVVVSNNILVVMPKPGFRGVSEITVAAFYKENPDVYTKVPLKFIVS